MAMTNLLSNGRAEDEVAKNENDNDAIQGIGWERALKLVIG
jgi:hypothetical protein